VGSRAGGPGAGWPPRAAAVTRARHGTPGPPGPGLRRVRRPPSQDIDIDSDIDIGPGALMASGLLKLRPGLQRLHASCAER
jgi:hypothetical protein